MGVCLCKDKVLDSQQQGTLSGSDSATYGGSSRSVGGTAIGSGGLDQRQLSGGGIGGGGGGGHHLHHLQQQQQQQQQQGHHQQPGGRFYGYKVLSETVDALVLETLHVIGSIVDNEPEPPSAMAQLHDITDHPDGWTQLVKSMLRVVPIDHPMGPSVIMLLLDDSPLPTKDAVLQVVDMITQSVRRTPQRERNLCVILGCLMEKMGGPSSLTLLSDTTLSYLIGNLDEGIHADVMLFSLIALEKFAQKTENKHTIQRKLTMLAENPLVRLERHCEADDYVLRQVGYCAKWSLDNYFTLDTRQYSYETVDVSNVNVMLNTKDVSEYLKISPDGLEARCDAYSFESVRCTFQVTAGCWYYEVLIVTPGVMQIGWATKDSTFLSHEGYGIGDDKFSLAFDGCRRLIWHAAQSMPYDLPAWSGGTVLGCLLDVDARMLTFSMNGVEGRQLTPVFANVNDGFFAAASFMSFQQCRFNFGATPFRYPPSRPYQHFNDHASLPEQDKVVLPRHIFLQQLRKLSVREDSCTLCFDNQATVRIEPCKHKGFCIKCAAQLQFCPLCRGEIVLTVHDDSVDEDLPNSAEPPRESPTSTTPPPPQTPPALTPAPATDS